MIRKLLGSFLILTCAVVMIALPIFTQWLGFHCPDWMLGPAATPGRLGDGIAFSLFLAGFLALAGLVGGVFLIAMEYAP